MADQSTAIQQWEEPSQLAKRLKRMHELQAEVMKPNVDYGVIPGTKKPTLFKPGAELLKVTFGLSDRLSVEDLGGDGVVHYRVLTDLYDRAGMYLGCGYGECSSDEEKYKWRGAVCDAEWETAEEDLRRLKFYRNGNQVKQIRVNSADVANTILKMAKKRSEIDAVLNVLGASRIYNQDLEDLSPELRQLADEGTPKSSKPDVTPTTEAKPPAVQAATEKPGEEQRKKQGMISDKQVGRIFGIAKKVDVDEETMLAFIKAKWGHDHFWQLSWRGGQNAQYNNFCKLLEEDPDKFVAYAKGQRQAPPPDADQPATDEDVSFGTAVIREAEKAGYVETDGVSVAKQIEDEIDAEFSIKGGLDKVEAKQMGQVFDFYHAKAEAHANASV